MYSVGSSFFPESVNRDLQARTDAMMREIPAGTVAKTFKIFSDGPKTRAPGFIGPLEYNSLPDSTLRKAIWIAYLFFLSKDAVQEHFEDFILSLPGISIVKRIDHVEYIKFPPDENFPNGIATAKHCIDEVLEETEYYKQSLASKVSYGEMRRLAFSDGKPLKLMKNIGYAPASSPQVDDLIVYFSNIKETTSQLDQTYIPVKKPAHYARVVEVDENKVVVESRLASRHIIRHPLDGIPYVYGNSYLIYRKTI